MPLDISLVSPAELALLLGSFFVTFVVLGQRVRRRKSVYYGGGVLAVITALTAFFIIPDQRLGLGLLIAIGIIIWGGRLDESRRLSPWKQFAWQAAAVLAAVAFGWTITRVTNIFGPGVILLPWGSVLAAAWLLGIMNALNLLDGVDGAAGSVSVAAFATLALISLLPSTQDHATLLLSLNGLGVMLAFLIWNWSPARVYLGTVGSWFVGLYIGMVAIIGGGKIATTLLVLAIPLVDVILVIIQRLRDRRAPWQGDRERHVHFRLLKSGLSPRKISLLLGLMSLVSGLAGVLLQTKQKLLLFAFVALGMIVLVIGILYEKSTSRSE